MSSVKENLEEIKARIAKAAHGCSRDPASIRLVAVTKRVELADIQSAVKDGQVVFGENYLQESQLKIAAIGLGVSWHFIGHLQSNKAAQAAAHFDMVETVDRIKLAKALDKHLGLRQKTMQILVQVNVGREVQKSGVMPENAAELIRQINHLTNLRVMGLMTMPPLNQDPEQVRPYFRQLREISEDLQGQGLLGMHGPVELSMGMSGDFEVAIAEGATLVRVGTAIFGQREC